MLNYVISTLLLYLARHLMSWLDTSDDKERYLWIFSFLICTWHILKVVCMTQGHDFSIVQDQILILILL